MLLRHEAVDANQPDGAGILPFNAACLQQNAVCRGSGLGRRLLRLPWPWAGTFPLTAFSAVSSCACLFFLFKKTLWLGNGWVSRKTDTRGGVLLRAPKVPGLLSPFVCPKTPAVQWEGGLTLWAALL